MRFIKHLILVQVYICCALLAKATNPVPVPSGWWKFENSSDLLKPEYGTNAMLELVGTQTAEMGPEDGNRAVRINTGSYYRMKHLMMPNDGGTRINEYTLMFDFKISDLGTWRSFFQTSADNSTDGDFFINPSGNIGVSAVGYSGTTVVPGDWYRLLISVKNGSNFTCYLDGNLLLEGAVQSLDGRFSLDSILLVFADDNGEDGSIYCSELAIWNQALTADNAKELNGYGHQYLPFLMSRIPFLQSPGKNSMTICWHDTSGGYVGVEYGKEELLGTKVEGSHETIKIPYFWNTVKLTGLESNTTYFYKVISGDTTSGMYSFRTLPDSNSTAPIRFLIFGDTHTADTSVPCRIIRSAKDKIKELYGSDIENHLTSVIHTGDLVLDGSIVEQYSSEFFYPFSELSGNIPLMTVIGNHEGESSLYYQYMKYDDLSAISSIPALKEKIWAFRVANSLFIGINTNITGEYGNIIALWLDSKLKAADKDSSLDFVYLFFHHPPYSELWNAVSTFDAGPAFVLKRIIPICRKYAKVQELHYGHTHGFEIGTVTSPVTDGDFRITCNGGGGGALDPWGPGLNHDYPDIQKTYSVYMYELLEIDPASQSFRTSVYSLGTQVNSENSVLLDSWYKKKNQPGPERPSVLFAGLSSDYLQCSTSVFEGVDSLMSVNIQLIDSLTGTVPILDTIIHWKDIYGIDAYDKPVDVNHDIDLYHIKIPAKLFSRHLKCTMYVRYRDHNLKWSSWSDPFTFNILSNSLGVKNLRGFNLGQSFPNPCAENTTIQYFLPEVSKITFQIFDEANRLISEYNLGQQDMGSHQICMETSQLVNGFFFYKMVTDKGTLVKKLIKY